MHELSVTQALCDMVVKAAKENGAKKVTAIDIVLGEKSGYVPECIEQYFELLAEGTVAKKAALRFRSAANDEFYIDKMEIES